MGEEQGGSADDRPTWFVDPIDGTMNFAHGHPFFAISIGLLQRGQALLGAVVAPALQSEWHGYVGGGAFRNGAACRVSANSELRDALVATGFSPLMHREGSPENNMPALYRGSAPRCGAFAAGGFGGARPGLPGRGWHLRRVLGAALVRVGLGRGRSPFSCWPPGGRVTNLLGGAYTT